MNETRKTAFLSYVAATASSCAGIDTALINCVEGESGIHAILKTIINILIPGVGILGVLGIIIVGIQYMTSADNAEKMANAKKHLLQIIAGTVLFVASGALIQFLWPDSATYTDEELSELMANTGQNDIASGATNSAGDSSRTPNNSASNNPTGKAKLNGLYIGMHAPATNELSYVKKAATYELYAVECDFGYRNGELMCYHSGNYSSSSPTMKEYFKIAKAAGMKVAIDRPPSTANDKFNALVRLIKDNNYEEWVIMQTQTSVDEVADVVKLYQNSGLNLEFYWCSSSKNVDSATINNIKNNASIWKALNVTTINIWFGNYINHPTYASILKGKIKLSGFSWGNIKTETRQKLADMGLMFAWIDGDSLKNAFDN